MGEELVREIEEIWGEDWEMYVSPYVRENIKSVEMIHRQFPITVILDDRKIMLRVNNENVPIPFELLPQIQKTIEFMV